MANFIVTSKSITIFVYFASFALFADQKSFFMFVLDKILFL